ncbi:hypothetical protein OPV22_007834 [Ensete ventricosum]|uniref:Uncharacterized protein n=1 Tax=Ensete ventricosum TaxID=4639 RepID=A0AAV8RFM0_ENSVE|nr:hypothetical protein OPV22_007834 [Ensete ventricosum]
MDAGWRSMNPLRFSFPLLTPSLNQDRILTTDLESVYGAKRSDLSSPPGSGLVSDFKICAVIIFTVKKVYHQNKAFRRKPSSYSAGIPFHTHLQSFFFQYDAELFG